MTDVKPTPGSDAAARPGASVRVGALHRQGDQWRFVALEAGPAPRVLEHATFRGDPKPGVAAAAQRLRLARLVRVAPARGTVVRAASVPEGDAAETASALALLAEAQLPASIPTHRRAAGLIPNISNNGSRAALLTGFDAPADPPGPLVKRLEESWTTEPAALAFLRGGRSPWAGAADPSSGAITIVASGPERAAARILFEDPASPARFGHHAARVLAETCVSVGLEAPQVRDLPGVALDPEAAADLRNTVKGVPVLRDWLDEYGVALGAAMAGAQPDELARSLALLRESPRVVRASPARRAATWLARPANAAGVIVAALLVMLLTPLIAAETRLGLLNAKGAGLAELSRLQDEQRLRAATYAQLERSRWPMSKLLADLARAMPVGVVADSIVIGPDQGVTVQATADSSDQLAEFQKNLNAGRVFGNVQVNRDETSSSGVRFDLTCNVVNASGVAPDADDFAAKPLAVRLYGEGASNTAAPLARPGATETTRAPARTSSRERSDGDDDRPERSSRTSESRRPDSGASPPGQPPPPLTDADIAAMDLSKTQAEWASRRTFPQKNPTTDAATKARLEEEVVKLRERMTSLRKPGGGS